MKTSPRGTWIAGIVAIGQVALASHAAQSHPPQIVALDIKHQALGDALNELARQSGLQIVLYSEVGEGISAPALLGNFTPTQRVGADAERNGARATSSSTTAPSSLSPNPPRLEGPLSISALPAGLNGGHSLLLAQAETREPAPASPGRADTAATAARDEAQADRSELVVQEVDGHRAPPGRNVADHAGRRHGAVGRRARSAGRGKRRCAVSVRSEPAVRRRRGAERRSLQRDHLHPRHRPERFRDLQRPGRGDVCRRRLPRPIDRRHHGCGRPRAGGSAAWPAGHALRAQHHRRRGQHHLEATDREARRRSLGDGGPLQPIRCPRHVEPAVQRSLPHAVDRLAPHAGRLRKAPHRRRRSRRQRFAGRPRAGALEGHGQPRRLAQCRRHARAPELRAAHADRRHGTRARRSSISTTRWSRPRSGITAPNGVRTVNSSWVTGDIDTTWARRADRERSRHARRRVDGGLAHRQRALGEVDQRVSGSGCALHPGWRQHAVHVPRNRERRPAASVQPGAAACRASALATVSTGCSARITSTKGAVEHGKANLAIGTFSALEALNLPAGTTWCGLPGANPRADCVLPAAAAVRRRRQPEQHRRGCRRGPVHARCQRIDGVLRAGHLQAHRTN